jgi:hypothetical protein
VKKRQRKKKVDVYLFATDAQVIFWNNIFCNTTLATSFAAPLQYRFCSIVFYIIIICSIASTPPLQHCLLQQHFNTASVTPSFVASLQHRLL